MDLALFVLIFFAGLCIGAAGVAHWASREIAKVRAQRGTTGTSSLPASKDADAVTRLDSANHYMVGDAGGLIVINRQPIGKMSKPAAVNLAAWLSVLADPEGKEFERVNREIREIR